MESMGIKMVIVTTIFLFFFCCLAASFGIVTFMTFCFSGKLAAELLGGIGLLASVIISGYLSFPILWRW